jgi:DNA-directed RNA polymerase specialized sigma24 family protein
VTTRNRRPLAIIAPDPSSDGAIALRSVPEEPFSLRGVRVQGVVHDEHDCDAVLVALARGADVVVAIDLPPAKRAVLLDDMARIADLREAGLLTSEERAVVDGLVEGRTLTDVARMLGMSRRTATRRLAGAKLAFGAATTIELILAVSHSMS